MLKENQKGVSLISLSIHCDPRILVATTGNPIIIASIMDLGIPSLHEGKQKISMEANKSLQQLSSSLGPESAAASSPIASGFFQYPPAKTRTSAALHPACPPAPLPV